MIDTGTATCSSASCYSTKSNKGWASKIFSSASLAIEPSNLTTRLKINDDLNVESTRISHFETDISGKLMPLVNWSPKHTFVPRQVDWQPLQMVASYHQGCTILTHYQSTHLGTKVEAL